MLSLTAIGTTRSGVRYQVIAEPNSPIEPVTNRTARTSGSPIPPSTARAPMAASASAVLRYDDFRARA